MSPRFKLMVALALACCASASPAVAQQPAELERAKASFRAGANAYAAGDYLAAIQALEAAYSLTPLPAIAFSLAQAERKQYAAKKEREHLERALVLFRRYLEQEPNGARRSDAQLALAELQPLLGGAQANEPKGTPPQRPTRLMIVSDTPGVSIKLDGGASAASPLIREVTPGKHRARLQASGYLDVERDVTAIAGELILTEVRLPERPTSLYVWAPEGADIYVDGVYITHGGPLATIPLSSGFHRLAVSKAGKRLVRRDLRLQRGQSHTEYITLEPTTQRSLSEYLFIAGGAALGGGVILSAFAIRSENKAEDFLRRRALNQELKPADLLSYNAALAERSRFRTGATIGIAASLGMFVTGLFLHEFDRPNIFAPPPRPEHEARRLERRFQLSPVTATGDFGASLQLHF